MKNTYFEHLRELGDAWQAARNERIKIQDELRNAGDWDGLKEAYEIEKRDYPFPFSWGAQRAFRAYEETNWKEADTFMVNELPWDNGAEDFVKTLKEAGIREFVITDHSTALMDTMHELAQYGCTITGLAKVEVKGDGFIEPERTFINGIAARID